MTPENGWKWNLEQLAQIPLAADIEIAADVDTGITAGNLQETLEALAARITVLEAAP